MVVRAVVPPVVVSATRRVRRLRGPGSGLSCPDRPLSDGAVELRPIEKRDVGLVERAASDPEIRRRFGLSRDRPSEYLARFRDAARGGSAAAFVICDVGGESFGVVTVELGNAGKGQVGYWLLPEGRGEGRATRAVRLTARWALSQPGVARLELSTDPENTASQRVAERSGFRREGVLRSYHEVGGRREDAVFFSLLPGELEKRVHVQRAARAWSIARAQAFVLGWLPDRAESLECAAGVGLILSGGA